MATDPTQSLSNAIEWVFGALWMVLASLLGIIWKRSNDDRVKMEVDLKSVEDKMETKASKTDLEASQIDPIDIVYRSEYEQNRREVREDMKEIHRKLDRVIVDMSTGQTSIMSALAVIKNGIK